MWLDLRTFTERYYPLEKRPDPRTLRKYIRDGSLPGKRVGQFYYIDVDQVEKMNETGNPLADRILRRLKNE